MSLNSIMNIATTGLQTAQDQLKVTSNNITNVNTPGYIRQVLNQQALSSGGTGAGVTAGQVTLASDQYLESAQYTATAAAGSADASYNVLNQIQSEFGDLTDPNGIFNQAATALSSAATAAENPTSAASRQQVLANMSSFLGQGQQIANQIQAARGQADSQIASDVQTANNLLQNIASLNTQISAGLAGGTDITASQTQQNTDIQSLSKLIDVATSTSSNGSVNLRTTTGMALVTNASAVTLNYQAATSVNATTAFSPISVTTIGGQTQDLANNLSSGEIQGLLNVRDNSSVAINDQLNQYMSQFANAVNAAHNASSAVPAPASLTGKNLSQTVDEAVTGFTSSNGNPTETNLVTLDNSGNITHQLTVDFNPAGDGSGTWSLDNGASTGTFSAATFDTDLTNAFGGAATVSFTNGQLSITASGTGGNNGVAVVDPPAGSANAAASKTGEGFSQFFGLNDLITSNVPTTNQTGLTANSNAGFTGGAVNFALKSPSGGLISTVNFTMPSSGTMTSLVNALNDTNTGVGRYGTFSLDQNGALTFQGFGNPPNTLSITSDSTSRLTTSGPSFSQFFGLGGNASTVASQLQVNSKITNNPSLLALAQVDLSAVNSQGQPGGQLQASDGSGGTLLSNAGNVPMNFNATSLSAAGSSTVAEYGSNLAGQVGTLSADAKTASDSADAQLTEATSRRSAAEGVNLDQELVNLTTYQQAYSAAGRLVEAVQDMYTVLTNMMAGT